MKQRFENRTNLAMSEKHIELIRQGIKTTTLRGLRYNYPIETIIRFYNNQLHGRFKDESSGITVIITDKKLIRVPDGLTEEICKSEGNYTKEELIEVLEGLGFGLPTSMYLYTFTIEEKCLKRLELK